MSFSMEFDGAECLRFEACLKPMLGDSLFMWKDGPNQRKSKERRCPTASHGEFRSLRSEVALTLCRQFYVY
jgi:hypothetical protein